MLVEGGLQFCFGPGVELLDEDDADAEVFALLALDAEVVADLAAADEQAARALDVVVGEDIFEGRLAELRDGGGCVGVAQHALGREDDERLAPRCVAPDAGGDGSTAQALEGCAMTMLSLAASWRKRSMRAEECSGPWPS